jgi:GNAT superfamily N-acetyltransferase
VIDRVAAFLERHARAQASQVVELPWGFAVLQHEFPLSHWHNRVVVSSSASLDEVVSTTDRVLDGLGHRYVVVEDDELGHAFAPELMAAGYEHETIATMLHSGVEIPEPAHEVREVSLEELRPAIIRDWRVELPDASEECLAQLADRTALNARGADLVLLAVYAGGDVVAHAELYVDRVAGVAQFERLVTDNEARGRGYGTALLRHALRRTRGAGCDASFLTADDDDWPLEWYRRTGYAEIGRTHHFDRV